MVPERAVEKDEGFAISQQSGQYTNTGQLDRRTLLHKRYHIQRIIGQGGMGAVYQAKDLKRQTVCAIKEMSLSMVSANERPQAIENFKIEAKMLWGLNHPNLPAFTGFFSEGQRYYMVMEYIDGNTLEELLERNRAPFSERRVLGWARQLCDVLEYLHSQHPPIIFRDMKPGNIMLTRNGRIKLVDFGIARFFRATTSQDTQLLGTPGFAPPEQYGKTQTDERSDIYSLAITLFQLLTDTLSETGFGLKDVRAVNSQISLVVARTLERAASLDASERYNNVAEFRRALLGEGTFVFENGDQATTPEDLAELCARYPEEASDYLADGEIESWLQEIGEPTLAKAARHIRAVEDEPLVAVEQFLQVVIGPNARLRSYSTARASVQAPVQAPSRNNGRWFSRKATTTPIAVSPSMLDFGTLYSGISAPLIITVKGNQGFLVNGTVYTNEPWILLDQNQFDGIETHINVRIDSTGLHGSARYTGTIIIAPSEDAQKDIEVMVDAEVIGAALNQRRVPRSKTIGADLDDDEDDDEDALTMGTMSSVYGQNQSQVMMEEDEELDSLSATKARENEDKIKYGQPGTIGLNSSWDPARVPPRQQVWFQRSLALLAAFMLASLVYTIISHVPPLLHTQLVPPDPWFAAILVGMAPAATLGALLVNKNNPWDIQDAIDRACTGMASSFLVLTLFRISWQLLFSHSSAMLQLVVLLLVTSIGAVIGTTSFISNYINYGISWAMSRMYQPTIAAILLLGGAIGFILTIGLVPGWSTAAGIVTGLGIAGALVKHIDHLMKENAHAAP